MSRELREFDNDDIEFLEGLISYAEANWPKDLERARRKFRMDPELIEYMEQNIQKLSKMSALVKAEMTERGIPFED